MTSSSFVNFISDGEKDFALNSVECVMEGDRIKDAQGQGLDEHNYTNTSTAGAAAQSGDDGNVTITKLNLSRTAQPTFRAIAPKGPVATLPYITGVYTSDRPKILPGKKDVFNRIRRSEAELGKAAEMVRGGMTFQTASDTFNIPISTIRFYMARRGILPQRRRGRGSNVMKDDDLMHPPFEIIHYRLPDIDKPI